MQTPPTLYSRCRRGLPSFSILPRGVLFRAGTYHELAGFCRINALLGNMLFFVMSPAYASTPKRLQTIALSR